MPTPKQMEKLAAAVGREPRATPDAPPRILGIGLKDPRAATGLGRPNVLGRCGCEFLSTF